MTTPTRQEILTMDYSNMGSPWVNVVTKPGIDVDGLDYSSDGQPWWGVEFIEYTLLGSSSKHIQLSNIGIILNILRPISDIYVGNWTTEAGGTINLFESIDELVVNDLDYIQSELNSTSSSVVFKLDSTTDPNVHTGHFFRYRYKRDNASSQQNLTAMLKQGNSTIGSWVHNNISDSWTTAEQELTEVQAESISDYTNLSIKFIAETEV
jgi:hypothetical protein